MMVSDSDRVFRRCPKSGRFVGVNWGSRWVKLAFPLMGVLAVVWFIIRVVPQPARLAYPCQQFAATTIATYAAGVVAATLGIIRQLRRTAAFVREHGLVVSGLFVGGGMLAMLGTTLLSSCSSVGDDPPPEGVRQVQQAATAAFEVDPFTDKTVVRVYDPTMSSFKVGTTPIAYYWHTFDQMKLRQMLETALLQITGASTSAAAWQMILPNLSATTKIAVKANMNDVGFYPNDWYRSSVSDPAMMIVLAKSLVAAGAAEQNITIFDWSRKMPDLVKTEVHAQCPGVVLHGNEMAGSTYRISFPDIGKSAAMPQAVMDADYLIDLFLLKHHSGSTSASFKNLAGMAGPDTAGILHGAIGYESSRMLPTLITDPAIKKRLKLSIGEAIFGCQEPTEYLDKSVLTKADFFPGGLASSLVVSRNPFLLDNVVNNFMNVEKNNTPNKDSGTIGWLKNSVGLSPSWVAGAIDHATVVNGGTGMPPKDLAYDPTVIEFISLRSGGSVAGGTGGTGGVPVGAAGAPLGTAGSPVGIAGTPVGTGGSSVGRAGAPKGSAGSPMGSAGSPMVGIGGTTPGSGVTAAVTGVAGARTSGGARGASTGAGSGAGCGCRMSGFGSPAGSGLATLAAVLVLCRVRRRTPWGEFAAFRVP